MEPREPVSIPLRALKEYIDRIGGSITIENTCVEIVIPVEVEEVAGGIQYRMKGRIVDDSVVLEECFVLVETERVSRIDVKDLIPWLRYIAERFG